MSLTSRLVLASACALCSLLASACHARSEAPGAPAPGTAAAAASVEEPKLEVDADPAARATESSGAVVARVGGRLVAFAADADDAAIDAFDAMTLAPLATTPLSGTPRDLLLTSDGVLLVTLGDRSAIVGFESAGTDGTLREVERAATSVEPVAMALTEDDKTVLVTTGASHRLEAFTLATLERRWSKVIAREPRAVLVAGQKAFVTHAAAGVASIVMLDGHHDPKEIDLARSDDGRPREARHAFAMVRSHSGEGLGEHIEIPLVENSPQGGDFPGYGGGGGGMSSSFPMPPMMKPGRKSVDFDGFDFFDGPKKQFKQQRVAKAAPLRATRGMSSADAVQIDPGSGLRIARRHDGTPWERACMLPRAAIESARGMLVACEGGSEVVAFDTSIDGAPRGTARWEVPRGPAALAKIPGGASVFVWSPIGRAVASFAVDADPVIKRDVPRAKPMDEAVVRGRELFHRTGEKKISREGMACASCHPDGRDDGIVWSTPLGRRHSLTLAGSASRPATFGWGAEKPTIEAHIGETLKRLGGTGLDNHELGDVVAYIRSMKSVPRDTALKGGSDAWRGETVFHGARAGCAGCHSDDGGFTDHETHDISNDGLLLTPSLLGSGARTSYFHDGRFANLGDLLKNATGMGGIGELDDDERRDLEAYLRTL